MSSATHRRTLAVLCIKFEAPNRSSTGGASPSPTGRCSFCTPNLQHNIVRLREDDILPYNALVISHIKFKALHSPFGSAPFYIAVMIKKFFSSIFKLFYVIYLFYQNQALFPDYINISSFSFSFFFFFFLVDYVRSNEHLFICRCAF